MRTAALVLLAGCGRIGFGAVGEADDSHAVDSHAVDAACTSFNTWSTPARVEELTSSVYDWGGQISADGLAYYFQSDRTGTNQFYVARRPDRSSPFVTTTVDGFNSATAGDVTITGDELEMFFKISGAGACLYTSTRPDRSALWSSPVALLPLCTVQSICPYITPDGLTLYYQEVGAGIVSTTRATRQDAFTRGTPVMNLPAMAGCPALTGDQLQLYYEDDAAGDLFVTVRPSAAAQFPTPVSFEFDTTSYTEVDVSISADGLELFYAADTMGSIDIYRITRSCQ